MSTPSPPADLDSLILRLHPWIKVCDDFYKISSLYCEPLGHDKSAVTSNTDAPQLSPSGLIGEMQSTQPPIEQLESSELPQSVRSLLVHARLS